MATAIDGMRRDVRVNHVDIRSNSRVFATMWDYCLKYEPEAESEFNRSAGGSRSRTKRQRGSK